MTLLIRPLLFISSVNGGDVGGGGGNVRPARDYGIQVTVFHWETVGCGIPKIYSGETRSLAKWQQPRRPPQRTICPKPGRRARRREAAPCARTLRGEPIKQRRHCECIALGRLSLGRFGCVRVCVAALGLFENSARRRERRQQLSGRQGTAYTQEKGM
uniref:Secreted protein n=1 Tax=Steinernema glaseri TaxID=37863 RepID=A0A1I7YGN6_9BILA